MTRLLALALSLLFAIGTAHAQPAGQGFIPGGDLPLSQNSAPPSSMKIIGCQYNATALQIASGNVSDCRMQPFGGIIVASGPDPLNVGIVPLPGPNPIGSVIVSQLPPFAAGSAVQIVDSLGNSRLAIDPQGRLTANQGGSWTVAVNNFPASHAVTQSTSPWVVSLPGGASVKIVDAGGLNVAAVNAQGQLAIQAPPSLPPVTLAAGATVSIAPSSGPGSSIIPVVSGAAEGSHVLKATAGNLYSVYVTTAATAGFLMVFNAATAPVDGAVTPIDCIQAPANSTVGLAPGTPPEFFATAITAVFSSTGCFNKTVSTTAFFRGMVE